MNAARHQRLTELFGELRRLEPDARGRSLEVVRRDDPELAEEIELLLRHASVGDDSEVLPAGLVPVLPAEVLAAIAGFDPDARTTDRDREATGHGALHSKDPAGGSAGGEALHRTGASRGTETPDAGSSLGRYMILSQLGEGGMGVVYLAQQHEPRRLVALKVMRQGFGAASERLRKRFQLETQLLARLEHPGIARLYDVGTAPIDGAQGEVSVPFFAMEYVDGVPLVEFARRQKLDTRSRMTLMALICDAVAAAHRQGVVHRDLKPGNILVGADGQPKVLDFGVARALGDELGVTTVQTDVGQLIGTLPYMSPEQVSGDPRAVDARCDVYALGVVAYELLTGKLPVPVRDVAVAEAARRIRDDDPAPLSAVNRVFRGDLDTIIAKALEKDRDRRYPGADALAAEIRRYLADEPIEARPPSTMYQMRKFARRNRGLVAGLALAFLALTAGLVGTAWGLVEAQGERDAARDAERVADAERRAAVAAQHAEAQQKEAALAAERRASMRFDQVRALAKSFIYEFHDDIVDLPGSTPVRKRVLERALVYLDALAAEAGESNPQLLQEVAEGYVKVGMAQGYHSRGNLGDRTGALQSFQKALAIRESITAQHSDNRDYATSLLSVRNLIANLLFNDGRYEEALATFETVRRERERMLAETTRGSDEWRAAQRALSISHQWVGNALGELGRHEEALESAFAQRELMQSILDGVAGDGVAGEAADSARRDLAVAHEKVGDRLSGLERFDEAIEAYRESLAIREGLYRTEPDNTERRRDYVAAVGKIGDRLMLSGLLDEAEPHLRESLGEHAALLALDPANALASTDLVVSQYRLARFALLKLTALRERLAATGSGAAHESSVVRAEVEALRIAGITEATEGIAILQTLKDEGRLAPRFEAWFALLEALRDEIEAAAAQ